MANPADIQQTFALGLRFHRTGNLTEADKLYRAVLLQQPDHADSLHLLGVIHSQRGRHGAALELIAKAITLNPSGAGDYYSNYGLALAGLGKIDEAIAAYRRSLSLRPDLAAAHSNLGDALARKGQWADAVAAYQQAVARQPDFADAMNKLAAILLTRGAAGEAALILKRVADLRPDSADAWHNLGNALFNKQDFVQAIAAYRTAVVLRPDRAESHTNLGKALNLIEQIDDAIAAFKKGLALLPTDTDALNALGNACKDIARLPEAMQCYQRVVELDPHHLIADSNRVYSMYFSPDYDGPAVAREAGVWNQRHARGFTYQPRMLRNDRSPDRRLRVGYVSPYFRNHCQSLFTPKLLSHHNHDLFEIFCYADLPRSDRITERLRPCADVWRVTTGMSDPQLAEMIRTDGIDILVDLTMHMGDGRLGAFARKPALVQIAWLAYTGTTGVTAIDARLTDPYLDPPGENDSHYSERSVQLPHTFWCYDPMGMELDTTQLQEIGPPPVSRNGFVTFGCLNNFSKINDGVLEVWGRVMKLAPGSRLLLLAPPGSARAWVLQKLGQEGITPDRIEFVARQSRTRYLNEFARIDLCLDTMPCNGHTTSLDSAWMGVPVVSRVGRTAMGRAGWSQLSNLGLTDLAAWSDEDFVTIAANLAADLPRLAELRRTLRQRLTDSPIMDGPRFAGDVEAAYRDMWRRWLGL